MTRSLLFISLLAALEMRRCAAAKLGGCSSVQGSNNVSSILNIALGKDLRADMCKYDPVLTYKDMADQCSLFCKPLGIPILVGTESSGFNQADLEKICGGKDQYGESTVPFDNALVNNCYEWSKALNDIITRSSDFIAAVRNFTYSQQLYKATMAEKVRALQKEMVSEETKRYIEEAVLSKKMSKLRELLDDHLKDLLTDGILRLELKTKMEYLEQKADLLLETISSRLVDLDNYVNQCNKFVLGTGPNMEYMLDICSVTSTACIDHEEGRHVGCCCGVIPVSGAYSVDALTSARRLAEGDFSIMPASGRRLAVEIVQDTCGQAYEVSKADVTLTIEKLLDVPGGQEVLDKYEKGQRDAYPQYYEDCDMRRLEEDEDQGLAESEVSNVDESRQLQSFLTCSAPRSSTNKNITDPLKVAFSSETEQAICSKIPLTDADLAEQCNQFCAPHSVPILLGATSYGFDHMTMDSACLQLDTGSATFKTYSQAAVQSCHLKATAFEKIQDMTANLVAKIQILEKSQMLLNAQSQEASIKLQALIKEKAPTMVDAKVQSKKIDSLIALVRAGLEDFLGGNAASRKIKNDAQKVKEAAALLQESMSTNLKDLKSFLEDCNGLVTGVGPDNEYLLDLCSQTGDACIDAAEASHVGCCCGYNPILTLGTGYKPYTIQATRSDSDTSIRYTTPAPPTPPPTEAPVASEKTPAPTPAPAPGSKRKSTKTKSICGEAFDMSVDTVVEYNVEIGKIDGTVLSSQTELKKEKYPEYYGRCSTTGTGRGGGGSGSGGDNSDGEASTSKRMVTVAPLAILGLVAWWLS